MGLAQAIRLKKRLLTGCASGWALLLGSKRNGMKNGWSVIFWIWIVCSPSIFATVIYSLVFYDDEKELEVRENAQDRIGQQILQFLTPLYDDCEYFVHNQRTFGNESFHSICNRYYEKGSVVSFPIFKMKRQFAALDWNEMMRKKALGQADSEIQDWQTLLLERLVAALNA